MTNYNEKINQAKTVQEVQTIIEEINNKIKDNDKDFEFNFVTLQEVAKTFTDNNRDAFTNDFSVVVQYDRKKAFADLLDKPCYDGYIAKYNTKTSEYTFERVDKLFKFADLEKGFREYVAELDVNGNKIIDKQKTIFDSLRVYGLLSVFIRNLQKSNFEIDKENGFNLANVVVDNEKVFADVDGKVFESNSNNALEKQLNIIVKFFGYDVQMLKRDLPVLKIKAQKINQDRQTARFKVNAIIDDTSILKFADVVFGVVASRMQGLNIEIVTAKTKK